MLAQLVKASVRQAEVERFKPHLGYNWLGCGVFLVKSRHFGLPLAQTITPNWQSSKRVARLLYKRGVFTNSIPEEMRTTTVPSLTIFLCRYPLGLLLNWNLVKVSVVKLNAPEFYRQYSVIGILVL